MDYSSNEVRRGTDAIPTEKYLTRKSQRHKRRKVSIGIDE